MRYSIFLLVLLALSVGLVGCTSGPQSASNGNATGDLAMVDSMEQQWDALQTMPSDSGMDSFEFISVPEDSS